MKNTTKYLVISGVLVAICFTPIHGSSIGAAAYNTIESAGSALAQRSTLNFVSGTTCVDNSGAHRTDCTSTGSGGSANQNIRSFGAGFDGGGSPLTTNAVTYATFPITCTIAAWNITVDTGTISFDVWKVGTGTAIPTVSNSILSGGFLSIASGTAVHSTTLTDFTSTAVTANDIFGIEIEAVSSATKASLVIQCNATT
jgi:hypothetical protein